MNQFTTYAAVVAALSLIAPQPRADDMPSPQLAREVLAELVAFRTTTGSGETVAAAGHVAQRLLEAGFPAADVQVLKPKPDLGVLVARYRGSDPSLPAALVMAHMDVVSVAEGDWSVPAFQLTEKDGYFYGRGSFDDKSGVAMLVSNFIRLRQSGFVPQRDLILLVTADEETEQMTIAWILDEHRDLVDAGFAFNSDGGFVEEKDGQPRAFLLQVAEKVYLNYHLVARSTGGHSSRPTADNAIYKLAGAISRIAAYTFPENIGEATAGYLRQFPDTAESFSNALRRTTCVVTKLKAGNADNALPEQAEANVNCRMLPQESAADVESRLRELIGPDVELVQTWTPVPSPPSPLSAGVVTLVRQAAAAIYPGLPIVPQMSTGASDGAFTRNAGIPTYGVSAVGMDPEDDRAHGIDERLPVPGFLRADRFWYRLLQSL